MVQGSGRKPSGTSSKRLRNVPALRISLRMIHAALARDCATWLGEHLLDSVLAGMIGSDDRALSGLQTETAT